MSSRTRGLEPEGSIISLPPAPRVLPSRPMPTYLPVSRPIPNSTSTSTSIATPNLRANPNPNSILPSPTSISTSTLNPSFASPPPSHPPSPSPTPSPLTGDPALYARIASSARKLSARHIVGVRSGAAWAVRAGQVFRLTTPAGPQVGDLNVWALGDARERFWAARTRQLHAAHLTAGHRLWSCLPYLRPLATITADSVAGGAWGAGPGEVRVRKKGGTGGGKEAEAATAKEEVQDEGEEEVYGGGIVGCHDLLGTRCDPYVNTLLSGSQFDFQCHSNLTRAVLPWGLNERDVHDVLNVFQVTGLDSKGRYWMGTSPARPGDYLEFFAETDLLCAMSACPGGDLSRFGWSAGEGVDGTEGGDADAPIQDPMLETCRPLGVEIYDLVDRDEVLRGWKEPERPAYVGMHGMKMPVFGVK